MAEKKGSELKPKIFEQSVTVVLRGMDRAALQRTAADVVMQSAQAPGRVALSGVAAISAIVVAPAREVRK